MASETVAHHLNGHGASVAEQLFLWRASLVSFHEGLVRVRRQLRKSMEYGGSDEAHVQAAYEANGTGPGLTPQRTGWVTGVSWWDVGGKMAGMASELLELLDACEI